MRVKFESQVSADVTPKDLILALIGRIGAAGGTGYAVEYAGSAIRGMSIEDGSRFAIFHRAWRRDGDGRTG